jgi:hypothetical protein
VTVLGAVMDMLKGQGVNPLQPTAMFAALMSSLQNQQESAEVRGVSTFLFINTYINNG